MTFFTALTGLNAAQTELTALSHNIANVGTTGFKKSRVEFGDIVARSQSQANNTVNGVGVSVAAVKQQFGQGGYATSSNALDLSIGGQGFFVVKTGVGATAPMALTRNGAFQVENGVVVDNQGRELQVMPTTADGTVTATGMSGLTRLVLPELSGTPQATSSIRVVANLPAAAAAPALPFNVTDATTYNHATSTAIYDDQGNASTATVYYRRVESAPGDTSKYWDAHVFIDGAEVAPTGGGMLQLTFDEDGVLTNPTGGVPFAAGMISHADSTALAQPFNVAYIDQDGYAPGKLESVGVDEKGIVRAGFSNGETIALGRVALANVQNPQNLTAIGSASWQIGSNTGRVTIGGGNEDGFGAVNSGSLERSNVDLTEELVGLISAQRNFQANARAIDTSSSVLETIIQLRS